IHTPHPIPSRRSSDLRLYVAEEEACLNVVLDASESMALGTPAKWPAALRLVAALAFLGLAAMDRVILGTLDGRFLPPLRGRDRRSEENTSELQSRGHL